MSVPPDPSRFNAIRARWAAAAIAAHNKSSAGGAGSPTDALASLLCNLNHWADRNGADMAEALEKAATDYECETGATRV